MNIVQKQKVELMISRHKPSATGHKIVIYNDTIYLSGMTAPDKTQNLGGQVSQIISGIGALLEDAGSSLENVLTATIFVTDIGQKALLNTAWAEGLSADHFPARTVVGVASLGAPETLVEIACVAGRNGK